MTAAAAEVRSRVRAAVAKGEISEALAREVVEAHREDSPVKGPWRFRRYLEKAFDYGTVTGIALEADHDKTDACRRQALIAQALPLKASQRQLMMDLLRGWLAELNRDGAPGWPGVSGDDPLEGKELKLVSTTPD